MARIFPLVAGLLAFVPTVNRRFCTLADWALQRMNIGPMKPYFPVVVALFGFAVAVGGISCIVSKQLRTR